MLKCVQFHVRHRWGLGICFYVGFGVDISVKLRIWCDLCEKLSIDYRLLSDFIMSFVGYAMNSCWSDDCEGVVLCEILSLMWLYSSCVSCFGVWVVVSNWKMEQIVIRGIKWEWEIVQSS